MKSSLAFFSALLVLSPVAKASVGQYFMAQVSKSKKTRSFDGVSSCDDANAFERLAPSWIKTQKQVPAAWGLTGLTNEQKNTNWNMTCVTDANATRVSCKNSIGTVTQLFWFKTFEECDTAQKAMVRESAKLTTGSN